MSTVVLVAVIVVVLIMVGEGVRDLECWCEHHCADKHFED